MPDSQGRSNKPPLRSRRLTQLVSAVFALLVAATVARSWSSQPFSTRFRARVDAARARQAALRFPEARPPTLKASLHFANGAVQHLFAASTHESPTFEPIWEPESSLVRVEVLPAGVVRYSTKQAGEQTLVAGNTSLCEMAVGACGGWTGVSFGTSIEAAIFYLRAAGASNILSR